MGTYSGAQLLAQVALELLLGTVALEARDVLIVQLMLHLDAREAASNACQLDYTLNNGPQEHTNTSDISSRI